MASDGAEVDVIAPVTSGSIAPGKERAAFARAHEAIRDGRSPALVDVREVLVTSQDVHVVRAPLARETLADLSGPLSGDTVAAIGAHLFPALVEVGGPLGGVIFTSDVGLDDAGWVVLAPVGPHTSLVAGMARGAVAPEVSAGAEPDGRAALYSLGALLYRLATNRQPPTGVEPTPPSSWNHRVSPELDRAILLLLSSDPDARPLALAELQRTAGAPEDLRPLTQHSRPRETAIRPLPKRSGTAVVVEAAVLADLDPSARSLAAGLAGLPLAALDDLVRAGLPLVVDRVPAPQLRETHDRIREALGVEATTPRAPRLGRIFWSAAGLTAGAVPAGIGLALAPLLGSVVAAAGGVLGTGVAALGLWRAWRSSEASARHAAVDTAWRIQERGREQRSQWPAVAAVDQRIARFRVDLAGADLPLAAEADVRGTLKDLERALDGILKVLQTAEQALAAVDRSQLGVRLKALERSNTPEHRDERDKAASTLADLDDVRARRDRQLANLREIEAGLDDLATALAHPENVVANEELRRLARTAQALRNRGSSQ